MAPSAASADDASDVVTVNPGTAAKAVPIPVMTRNAPSTAATIAALRLGFCDDTLVIAVLPYPTMGMGRNGPPMDIGFGTHFARDRLSLVLRIDQIVKYPGADQPRVILSTIRSSPRARLN